jgi:peroxiredoxin
MQIYLQELDRLIENVRLTSIRMEPKKASESMAHLAKLKLDAGQHLASLTTASAQQVKTGRLAQLVALSHLSGLKDVQAARQLEDLASQLAQGSDPELAHQGRIVKFGFLIQNLQNGLIKDGQGVVKAAIELIDNDNYRGRPESASLTHAVATLEQMGFTGEAGELTRLAFQAFSSSSDPALRNQWWNELTKSSPATELFLRSVSDLGTDQQQAASVISAARGLVESYPNVITLENLAGFLSQIEYSGQMALSQQLAELIDNQRRTFLSSNSTVSGSPVYPGSPASVIDGYLGEHRLRAGWIGKSFTIQDLVDIDGKPLDPGSLSGKVVVVFFWTTGSLPCLRELPNLERTFNLLSSKGLAIVSINMDPDAAAFERFVVSNKLPWRSYRHQAGDNQLLTKQFGITMFPHTLLVDRSGKVVDLHVRGQKIVDRAQALLP